MTHKTPRLHQNPNDPAYHLLTDSFKSTPKVYRQGCFICEDMEFARMGMPLCNLCCACVNLGSEGHIAADGSGNCDDCGHGLCDICMKLPPQKEICSCSNPCCEVDVGVGIMTCGSYHCPTHGDKSESKTG